MLKISYAACICLSQLVSAQFALEMCSAARNRQKCIKPLFWRLKSSKVIEFGGNREPVYDFLLVISSNLGPISHRYAALSHPLYSDLLAKNRNFFTPLSFSALVWGDPFRIYEKALRFLTLESSRQPTLKIW